MTEFHEGFLIWVTPRIALNPANIVSVFYGKNGVVLITLLAGDEIHANESDLTVVGRELLLPPKRERERVSAELVGASRSAPLHS